MSAWELFLVAGLVVVVGASLLALSRHLSARRRRAVLDAYAQRQVERPRRRARRSESSGFHLVG